MGVAEASAQDDVQSSSFSLLGTATGSLKAEL